MATLALAVNKAPGGCSEPMAIPAQMGLFDKCRLPLPALPQAQQALVR
jgi:hypothetical protein